MAAERPRRILVMEDDLGHARLLQRVLTRMGYAMDLVQSGEEGVACAATGAYSVLLVDYRMPGKDGLEVLRALADRAGVPPVVLLTGYGDEQVAVDAMKLGASDYLVKDVAGQYLGGLSAVLCRVLRQPRVPHATQRADRARQDALATLEHQVAEHTAALTAANAALHHAIAAQQQAEEACEQVARAAQDVQHLALVGRMAASGPAHMTVALPQIPCCRSCGVI